VKGAIGSIVRNETEGLKNKVEERDLLAIVMAVLADNPDPKRYWSVLKTWIKKEAGNEDTTICSTLKMPAARCA